MGLGWGKKAAPAAGTPVRDEQVERFRDAAWELDVSIGEDVPDVNSRRAVLDAIERNSTPAEIAEATRRGW